MIKKFNEYNENDFENNSEEINQYNGDIDSIDDIDWNQMNRLPSVYKNRYKVMIEYDIILPDKGDNETESIVRNIVEDEILKMKNGEVRIDSINKVEKRF